MFLTGEQMRKARQELGLTQKQLAPLLGYNKQQAVSDLERGAYTIRPQTSLLLQAYVEGYRPKSGWPKTPGPERPGPKPQGKRLGYSGSSGPR